MTREQPQQYGRTGSHETGSQQHGRSGQQYGRGGGPHESGGGQHGTGFRGSPFQGGQQGQFGGRSPQLQSGQQSTFGGGQQHGGGQQYGGGGQQAHRSRQGGVGGPQQPMDVKLEEGLTEEMRVALHDFVQAATVSEWCAERCIDEGPEMSECLRLCRDVADLATMNVQFMARDSVFGPEAAQVFADAAEVCAQECARHGHRHCQECAEVLDRAARSTRKMLASFGQGGQSQPGTGGTGTRSQQYRGGMETRQSSSGGMGTTQNQPGQGY